MALFSRSAAAQGLQQAPLQGPQVDYALDVVLDAEQHQLQGTGKIHLHNRTPAALEELYVHLYLNAFKTRRSLFFRDPSKLGRSGRLPAQWGWIQVHSLTTPDGAQLWPQHAVHSPDDPEDETDIRVELPEPLAAGRSLELSVVWTAQLPHLIERTGFVDEFHFAGQWFPKLAHLGPDGSWTHFRFHPQAEFYANFGNYSVTLDTPENAVVGASGSLQQTTQRGARTQRTFRAERVHDFAWTAWSHFEQVHERIANTQVVLLYPPGNERNAQHTLYALRHALPAIGKRFGPYPYPHLTVVHPPKNAAQAGGMEYPTLITTGGPWYWAWLSQGVEQVTLHELAHQWFHGLLASNEAAWPFLDEGLTSFVEAQALSELPKDNSALRPERYVSTLAYYRWLGNNQGRNIKIAQAAADFPSFGALSALVYGRATALFATLQRLHGAAFERALSSYAQRFTYGHPTPEDLLASLEAELGVEATEQVRRALFERAWLDYAVESLTADQVVIVRRGNLEWPALVELTDANGAVQMHYCDGESERCVITQSGGAALRSALIDPQQTLLLDEDLTNNARRSVPSTGARVRSWMAYLAQLALWVLGP